MSEKREGSDRCVECFCAFPSVPFAGRLNPATEMFKGLVLEPFPTSMLAFKSLCVSLQLAQSLQIYVAPARCTFDELQVLR